MLDERIRDGRYTEEQVDATRALGGDRRDARPRRRWWDERWTSFKPDRHGEPLRSRRVGGGSRPQRPLTGDVPQPWLTTQGLWTNRHDPGTVRP